MSRRTFARFALAALAAAGLAASGSAQPPIPPASEPPPLTASPAVLRIDTSYPLEVVPVVMVYQFGMVAGQTWTERPAEQVGAAVAVAVPLPQPVAQTTPAPAPLARIVGPAPNLSSSTQVLNATVALVPQRVIEPCAGVKPQPLPQSVCASSAAPCCLTTTAGCFGTWYRELPGTVVSYTIKGNELIATLTVNDGGILVTFTLTADCAVTRDGTVHGVVAGVDVKVAGKADLSGSELADLALDLQGLVNHPFAFRCRPTTGGLIVSNLRCGPMDAGSPIGLLMGSYTKSECGAVPQPKAVIARRVEARGAAAFAPPCLPPCLPVDVLTVRGVGFADGPVAVCVETPPFPVGQPCPVAYPGPIPPPLICPIPTPPMGFSGPVPAGIVMPHPMPMPAPRGLTGTWSREFGPAQCVYMFKNGQLHLTLTLTGEDKGKTGKVVVLVTADYYPTRDGHGIVGIVTGCDVNFEGAAVSETQRGDSLKEIAKLHKALIGQPFSLTYRIQDDELMIGNLRFACDRPDALEEVLGMISGRFRAAGINGVSKPKSIVASECPATTGDVTVIEFKTIESVPPMLPPTPLPQTGTVSPACVMPCQRCEPCSTLPILEGVRQGWLHDLDPLR